MFETKLGRDIQCAKLSSKWGANSFKFFGTDDDYYINRVDGQDVIRNESEPCVYQLDSGDWIMLTATDFDKGAWKAYTTPTIDDTTSWTETTAVHKYTGSQAIIGTSVTRITQEELEALKADF